jgi:hypothetical protein
MTEENTLEENSSEESQPGEFVPQRTDSEFTTLEREFNKLAEQWRRETVSMSSSTDIVMHPAYYQIIGMGRIALPWILRELQQRGGHWFLALGAITRQNPVNPQDRGKVRKMTEAWLQWGRENGLLDSNN